MRGPSSFAILLLVLAACEGGRKPAAPAKTTDPCELITQDDVEAVFEAQATPGIRSQRMGEGTTEASCGYEVANPGSKFHVMVDVTVMAGTPKDAASARLLFETRRAASEAAMNGRSVSGLGDAAIWSGPEGAKSLSVLRGAHVLRIEVSLLPKDPFPLCRALAERALPRLP